MTLESFFPSEEKTNPPLTDTEKRAVSNGLDRLKIKLDEDLLEDLLCALEDFRSGLEQGKPPSISETQKVINDVLKTAMAFKKALIKALQPGIKPLTPDIPTAPPLQTMIHHIQAYEKIFTTIQPLKVEKKGAGRKPHLDIVYPTIPMENTIPELARIFQKATGKRASITHNPYGTKLQGAFLDFVTEMLRAVGHPPPRAGTNALGKKIERILKKASPLSPEDSHQDK